MLRQMEADIEAVRYDPGDGADRTAGQAQGARFDLRAARQMGHAADRQLSLRARRMRRAIDQGRRAQRPRSIARGLQLGLRAVRASSARRRTIWCRSRNTPARRSELVRPSSAARALFDGAPNIERVDRLVQTHRGAERHAQSGGRRDGRDGRRPARGQPESRGLTSSAAVRVKAYLPSRHAQGA